MVIHTGAGTLSTPMGEAEIDRLAEAAVASLRSVKSGCSGDGGRRRGDVVSISIYTSVRSDARSEE